MRKLLVLVLAAVIFAWGYRTFFDSEFLMSGNKKAKSEESDAISIPLPAVDELPERFEHRPLQPKDPVRWEPKSAKTDRTISQRAGLDQERRIKQQKWEAFYKESPKCKSRDSSWQIAVECANELLRANEAFERLYHEGKI